MTSKRTLAESPYLRLVQEGTWSYVERKKVTGIVAIIPITDQNEIILLEQYRTAVHAWCLELPAGLVGDEEGKENEDLVVAAQRELLEETGYTAKNWKELFKGPPSAGLSDEIITFYLATGLKKVESGGGVGGEQIKTHIVKLSEIDTWIDSQKNRLLIDPKVYAGLYFIKDRN